MISILFKMAFAFTLFLCVVVIDNGLGSDWIVRTERPSFSGSLVLSMTNDVASPT